MISFASSTGAAVCGEGVEDLDDLRALADLDATYAQGYALARPAPPWPLLAPGAAATSADRLEMGVRVAGGQRAAGTWSQRPRRAGDQPRRDRRRSPSSPTAGRMVADLLGADDVSLMTVTGRSGRDRRAALRAPRQPAGRVLAARRLPGHREPRRDRPRRPGRGRRPARRPGRARRARAPGHRRDADGAGRAGPRPPRADGGLPRAPAGVLARADRARPRRRAAARRRHLAPDHAEARCAPRPHPHAGLGQGDPRRRGRRPPRVVAGRPPRPRRQRRTAWRRSPPRSPGARCEVHCPGLAPAADRPRTPSPARPVRRRRPAAPTDRAAHGDLRRARRARGGPPRGPARLRARARAPAATTCRPLAWAVDTLAHESFHLRGILDEGVDGVLRRADAGLDGAAARRDARAGAATSRVLHFETGYPARCRTSTSAPAARTAARLDMRPDDPGWP